MVEEGDVEFDLRGSELSTLGGLMKLGREAHLRMLQNRDADSMATFLDSQRVLFHAVKNYTDDSYDDLKEEIRSLDSRLRGENANISSRTVNRLEEVAERVSQVMDDAGFTIDREKEFDPENALTEGLN